ncbi:MAG: hypothetical protein OCC45_16350 [Desulfotalea sp.]
MQKDNLSEIEKQAHTIVKENYYSKEEKHEILNFIRDVDRRKQQGCYDAELKELKMDDTIPVELIKKHLLEKFPLAVDPERLVNKEETVKPKKITQNKQSSCAPRL